jgi:hypothetical protein
MAADDASKDTILTFLLNATSDFIENYTGRKFARQEVTEKVEGAGLPDILVSITPVVSVSLVALDTHAYTDYSILDAEAGILQRRGGWTDTGFQTRYLNDAPSAYAEKRWNITYIGGYILPGWTGDPTPVRNLPYDLERAALEIVRGMYKNVTSGVDPNMTSYKIGETAAAWKQDAAFIGGDLAALGVPPSAIGILQHYRRPF